MKAHDLAADWSWTERRDIVGFRLGPRGRRVWSYASYGRGHCVTISSLSEGDARAQIRYVHPDTECVMVYVDPPSCTDFPSAESEAPLVCLACDGQHAGSDRLQRPCCTNGCECWCNR